MRADTSDRVRQLEKILVNGGDARACREHAAEQWGMGERHARRLIAQARETVKADWQLERVDMLAQQLSELSELQQRALEKGHLAVVLGCINQKARLVGLV